MIFLHAQRLRLDAADDVRAGKGAVSDVRSTPDPSTHDITLRRNRHSFEAFIGDSLHVLIRIPCRECEPKTAQIFIRRGD